MHFRTLTLCLLTAGAVSAQDGPLTAYTKMVWTGMKDIVLQSAAKMPEENYSFRPAETVRTYGEILGHIADAQYLFCSTILGETNPGLKIEETKKSKADLTSALKEAFAYCDKAYDGMTDESGVKTVKFFGRESPKLGLLNVNNVHVSEHYGNLVTYMRMKNLTPPTTEARQKAQPKK